MYIYIYIDAFRLQMARQHVRTADSQQCVYFICSEFLPACNLNWLE